MIMRTNTTPANTSVGAKLAREGDLKDAIAGKPCSYRDGVRRMKKARHPMGGAPFFVQLSEV